ncbi:hypothetical protein AK812_SmicGene22623 [Symbiodinium microadriaticum]|uniref:Uncharacterized protein n=1 Tax=Symbiodinium microadriaticum TaxID=2951 RepID=A0A1Q9DJD7_SYMMI|nr:hypothetical protein AK812_SmicGene22623 [Symbiodinium microadriaticum]
MAFPVVREDLAWRPEPTGGDSNAATSLKSLFAWLLWENAAEFNARLHDRGWVLTENQRTELMFDLRDFMELADICQSTITATSDSIRDVWSLDDIAMAPNCPSDAWYLTGNLHYHAARGRGDRATGPTTVPSYVVIVGLGCLHGTDDLHLQDIDDINEAVGSCQSVQGFCRVQSQSLAQWAHRKDARWDKARDRLQKQLAEKRREGRRKSDAEVPDLRPQMSHYIPMEDEGNIFRRTFLLFENSEKYVVGTLISAMMVTTIIISTVTFVMESMPEFQERSPKCEQLLAAGEPLTAEACEPVPMAFFSPIEAVCIAVFTIEYLVRLRWLEGFA